MIRVNKISNNELILGLAIIVFCCTLETVLHPPVIESTIKVHITPIESLVCETSKEGVVNCYVKK